LSDLHPIAFNKYAGEMGVPIYNDYAELLSYESLDLVLCGLCGIWHHTANCGKTTQRRHKYEYLFKLLAD
jgi:hypothetical protein